MPRRRKDSPARHEEVGQEAQVEFVNEVPAGSRMVGAVARLLRELDEVLIEEEEAARSKPVRGAERRTEDPRLGLARLCRALARRSFRAAA